MCVLSPSDRQPKWSEIKMFNCVINKISSLEVNLGIRNLFDDFAKLKKTDYVILSVSHDCNKVVPWFTDELDARNIYYNIHLFNHRNEEQYSAEIKSLMNMGQSRKNTIIFVCENQTISFNQFLKDMHRQEGIAVWRMMNSCEDLFSQSLKTKSEEIVKINSAVFTKLTQKTSKSFCYENDYGTEIHVTLDTQSWISKQGSEGKNDFVTFPIGELCATPKNINGNFVVFGAIHANTFLPFDCRLHNKKIKLRIKAGFVDDFYCDNKEIMDFLITVFTKKHVKIIDEFSIGTNVGISRYIAENSHINERFPGVHLGVGQNQNTRYAGGKKYTHIDFINPYGRIIFLNGEVIDLSQLKQCANLPI
jgi:leucyl aminopeptidase (aminopeptidase T)